MEIERKFVVLSPPKDYQNYPFHELEQGYLSTNPVVRVRREDEEYYLTYKGKGMLAREEHNLPLTQEAYEHLLLKSDGLIISKSRYFIPYSDTLTIELDIFHDSLSPLIYAEVEFSSVEEANAFIPPLWFAKEVTEDSQYTNSSLSKNGLRGLTL